MSQTKVEIRLKKEKGDELGSATKKRRNVLYRYVD